MALDRLSRGLRLQPFAVCVLTLLQVACSQPQVAAPATGSYLQQTQSGPATLPQGTTWWQGSYSCLQGPTLLRLRTRVTQDGMVEGLFDFGPPPGVSGGAGSFLLSGISTSMDGSLRLNPVRWLNRPGAYSMVGLSGVVRGDTYSGSVTGGLFCGDFSVTKLAPPPTTAAVQAPQVLPPAAPVEAPRDRHSQITRVALRNEGGTFTVPVSINNAITLNFVLDSGASDVSIPADVVMTLMRTGTISAADFLGQRTYRLADGSTVPSQTFRIRQLKVGDREISNVIGSVAAVRGSLLLGQSFLSRFKSWSIDNQRRDLVLE